MTDSARTHFLPTNLRELLTVLEGLRISVAPGSSREHISPRPVLQTPLRTAEIDVLTSGRSGDFPVLLEVSNQSAGSLDGQKTVAVPLSEVTRAVFRSEAERDIVLNRRLENVPVELLRLEVDQSLFGDNGEPRFGKPSVESEASNRRWREADQLGGAIAGLLAAATLHPGVTGRVIAFLEESAEPLGLDDLLDCSRETVGTAAIATVRRHHDQQGQDGSLLLEELVAALGETGMPAKELQAFSIKMTSILSSDDVRKRGSLSDERNVLLRALSLLVQRPSLDEVLADRVAGELPGPTVYLIASVLAGLRDGLARLSSDRKCTHADILGQIAAAAENDDLDRDKLCQLVAEALPLPEVGNSVSSQEGVGTSALVLEVCSFKKSAIVARALADIVTMPASWRLYLRDDDTLCLKVTDADESDGARAAAKLAEWCKRASKQKMAPTSRKAKAQAESSDEGMLPGLIDPQPDPSN